VYYRSQELLHAAVTASNCATIAYLLHTNIMLLSLLIRTHTQHIDIKLKAGVQEVTLCFESGDYFNVLNFTVTTTFSNCIIITFALLCAIVTTLQ
jgi:hypothetical protein